MKHDVSQMKAKCEDARMESVMHIRIDSRTLDEFRRIARSEARSPSNLVRKLVTDFVRSDGIVESVLRNSAEKPELDRSEERSPWDI